MKSIEKLNNLGIQAYNSSNEKNAIIYFNNALKSQKNPASYYFLGLIFQNKNKYKKAISYYKKALKLNPDIAIVHNNLGVIYLEKRDLDNTHLHLSEVLKLEPNNSMAISNMGNLLKAKGEAESAILYYKKATKLNPQIPQNYFNLANVYFEKKDYKNTIYYLEKTLQIYPNYEDALLNLGIVHKELGKLKKAKEYFVDYLKLNPQNVHAQALLGNTHLALDDIKNAKVNLNYALKIDPHYPAALNDLGNYYKRTGDTRRAIKYYKKTIKEKPDFAEAQHNLGVALDEEGIFDEAVVYLKNAIKYNSESSDTLSYLGSSYLWQCDWKESNKISKKLDRLTPLEIKKGITTSEAPFLNVIRWDNPIINLGVAKSWSNNIKRSVKPFKVKFNHKRKNRKKISVGYLSSDFHNHPTAHLMLGLFKLHDRKKFKIYAISSGRDDKSFYRKEIKKRSDVFLDIAKTSYLSAAKEIYKNRIDILIDLKGFTKGHTLPICALKPAPLIAHYLGFPGTIGADFIDYFITDRIVTPPGHEKYYSEKLVFLPNSYQVNDNKEKISNVNMLRSDFRLPEKSIVFSSFNHNYKISQETFRVWAKILKRVPKSVLWLLQSNPHAQENLIKGAKKLNIDKKRIIFTHLVPKDKHLKRIQLSDIALDTFTCNGHTTTSDALWAGVPVITLLGKHFASRVSASILAAINLPELVTKTPKKYEDLAIKLANNPNELRKVKEKLLENRLKAPLFNTENFVINIEMAYEIMWDNYSKDQKPKNIFIP